MRESFGFVFATPQEANPFRASLAAAGSPGRRTLPAGARFPRVTTHSFASMDIYVAVVGVGRLPAEQGARGLIAAFHPDWLVSAGVSGGLSDAIAHGDLLHVTGVVECSRPTWPARPLPGISEAPSNAAPGIRTGRVIHGLSFCSAQLLISPAQKREAGALYHALAADMESASVARVASDHGIPFSSVRVLSDSVDESLPLDFAPYIDEHGAINLPRLLLTIARHPVLLPALVRLGKRSTVGARTLAAHLLAAVQEAASRHGAESVSG